MTAAKEPQKGDKVSWNWGGGAPGGTIAETRDKGEIAIKSKRGNTVKKNASPDNPAVRIKRSGNDVVKRASELTVDEAAPDNRNKKEDRRSKRKADNQVDIDYEADEDGNDMTGVNGAEYHTKNKLGKEFEKGGKDAKKRQKTDQNMGTNRETDGPATSKSGNHRGADEEQGGDRKTDDKGKAEEEDDDDNTGDEDQHEEPRHDNNGKNKKTGNGKKSEVDRSENKAKPTGKDPKQKPKRPQGRRRRMGG